MQENPERRGPIDLEGLFGPGDAMDQLEMLRGLAEQVNEAARGVLSKVLVATSESQGHRTSDFHGCVKGELVCLDSICPSGKQDPDGPCGCGRAFYGMSSQSATTTAVVALVPITQAEYIDLFRHNMCTCGVSEEEAARDARVEALDMLDMVADWHPGTVVERRGWELCVRKLPPIGSVP
ncbi:DUF7715 family protein [Pseudonocardia spinosispora]|uniref:DUF7715 family protein n=1 Tax=Pseudonocardia spinosispora TaxID=103441 RepID=UPI0003FB127C|nr:hypothetical protein [Pseudonocardia spinosispora]